MQLPNEQLTHVTVAQVRYLASARGVTTQAAAAVTDRTNIIRKGDPPPPPPPKPLVQRLGLWLLNSLFGLLMMFHAGGKEGGIDGAVGAVQGSLEEQAANRIAQAEANMSAAQAGMDNVEVPEMGDLPEIGDPTIELDGLSLGNATAFAQSVNSKKKKPKKKPKKPPPKKPQRQLDAEAEIDSGCCLRMKPDMEKGKKSMRPFAKALQNEEKCCQHGLQLLTRHALSGGRVRPDVSWPSRSGLDMAPIPHSPVTSPSLIARLCHILQLHDI